MDIDTKRKGKKGIWGGWRNKKLGDRGLTKLSSGLLVKS
jgi:hypothetical protein